MEVRVSIIRHVVVDGKVYALDIDTTAKDVGGNADTLVELLEFLVAFDTGSNELAIGNQRTEVRAVIPLLLADAGVNSDTGEVAFAEKLVEFVGTEGALNEDDDLVELQAVEKLVELSVLLRLVQLDIVLLKTVEGQLGVIVHVDLKRVSHELLANRSDLLRQGSAEHHDLLVSWGGAENLLDVGSHIWTSEISVHILEIIWCRCSTHQLGPTSCRTHREQKP